MAVIAKGHKNTRKQVNKTEDAILFQTVEEDLSGEKSLEHRPE